MEFRVWAPAATQVELDLAGRLLPMQLGGSGWWSVVDPTAGPGTEYGFRLDGDGPFPDPRSAFQPDGVHGLSRVIDQGAFPWTDGAWRGAHLPSLVIYELHIGTFTEDGTFDAAVQRLDHLVELGVNAVEVMPVAEFPGERNWGYDGVDLFAPHGAYGGPDGMKRFVDACHHRGLAVVLDVVYNHFGPEGNYLSKFGPYLTDFYATPWGDAVNFDRPGSDEVRRYVLDNALMWLRDFHVDGLRLDAVHAIVDTGAVHILEELASEVETLSANVERPLFLIAESDLHDPRLLQPPPIGFGIDAQWSDDLHHALRTALTDERHSYYVDYAGASDVAATLMRGWPHGRGWSEYRGRTHGRPFEGLPGWKLLGYAQNHDQVGNRPFGDRLSPAQLKVASAIYLTAPFVPMLFMGEEWGASTPFQYFTSHTNARLGRAVIEGRRREFQEAGAVPDPQDPATFQRSKLDWAELEKPAHAELLEWYRSLIALRRTSPGLLDGRLDHVHASVDGDVLTVHRGPVEIVANFRTLDVRVNPAR